MIDVLFPAKQVSACTHMHNLHIQLNIMLMSKSILYSLSGMMTVRLVKDNIDYTVAPVHVM